MLLAEKYLNSFLCTCMYSVGLLPWGQKKVLGLVVLELQGVAFPDTGALRQTWDHCKTSRDS